MLTAQSPFESHVHHLQVPESHHSVRDTVTIGLMWTMLFVLLVWLLGVAPAHAQSADVGPRVTAGLFDAVGPRFVGPRFVGPRFVGPRFSAGVLDAQTAAAAPQQQPAQADPFWSTLRMGLTFEVFYEYNWNRPDDRVNILRAYDTRANTFGIQQAALVFDVPPAVDQNRRFGARLDLQYGQATETVQGGTANEPRPNVYRPVWQAFGSYVFPVGRGLQLDFGKFASTLGYETNYAKDNQAFSRAYLFNFLPFYHSGARVSLPVSDEVTVMYMLTNGIQQTEEFNDFKSHHVVGIIKPIPAVTWTVNYYVGQAQPDGGQPEGPDGFFRVVDTYVTYAANDRTTLGLDVNYVTNEVESFDPSTSLQGIGAYARYQVTPLFGAGVRWERLDDEGLFGGIDQVLQEVTATAEWKLADGFLVRAEFRRDWSNASFFPESGGGTRDHQNTFLVGMTWWVGNKTGVW